MKVFALLALSAATVSALMAPNAFPKALVAQTTAATDSLVALEACRRNTKKEKRQRNRENMKKFQRSSAPAGRGGGGKKKKALSRKKLTLKAQAQKEKGRESIFMSKLFLATGGVLTEKLDLGVL